MKRFLYDVCVAMTGALIIINKLSPGAVADIYSSNHQDAGTVSKLWSDISTTASGIIAGFYFQALQIKYSSSMKQEIKIKEGGKVIDSLEFIQDIIR